MKILLDECVDERLRHHFVEHDCQTARYAGLAGLSSGKLIAAAESLNFDVIVTVDQNSPYQQDLEGRAIRLVILRGHTARLQDLLVSSQERSTR